MLKIRRLIAAYIDYMIIFILIYIPVSFLSLLKFPIFIDVILGLLSVLIFFLLFIRKDIIFKNASIGKKILKLEIIFEQENQIPDKSIIIKRNQTSCLYFEFYLFQILFNNKSSGDYKYHTKVVSKVK